MADTPQTPSGDLVRKLSTILSADVAGYSRLMAENEEQTLRTFREHKEVFESLVAMHRGRIFNTAGDAILAEFGSAVEAVRCATEIQTALRTRNEKLPPDRQLHFRIGVNLGDVMVQGDDLLGDGVNVAARLQTAAEPGGVCVSGSVHDQIRNKLSLTFKEMGERTYKNIPVPIRTFSISEAAELGALPTPRDASHTKARPAKWLALAAIPLVIAGGYYVYSTVQRHDADQARIAAEAEAAKRAASASETKLAAERAAAQKAAEEVAAAKRDAELAAAKAAADKARAEAETEREKYAAEARVAELKRQQAEADRKRAEAEASRAAAEAKKAREAAVASRAPAAAAPSAGPAPVASLAAYDGVYSGPICFTPGRFDPARCFRAKAVVRGGKLTGGWPGRRPGQKVTLAAVVPLSGKVKIEMRVDNADGTRFVTIDYRGTIGNGRIDARGRFRGHLRRATLNFQRD